MYIYTTNRTLDLYIRNVLLSTHECRSSRNQPNNIYLPIVLLDLNKTDD